MFTTFHGLLITHIAAVIAGFLLGALVFLGGFEARTTGNERRRRIAEGNARERGHCSAVTARWCSLHGNCTCSVGDGENWCTEYDMDDPDCPLHGATSEHGTR